MAKRVKKAEPFSAGMYSVEGRLFGTRAAAAAYCKAQRVPAYKIGLVAAPKVSDAVKLSVGDLWSLRVFFDGPSPMMIFEHADDVHAFSVRMDDLADLVSTVKARVRELAQAGELL